MDMATAGWEEWEAWICNERYRARYIACLPPLPSGMGAVNERRETQKVSLRYLPSSPATYRSLRRQAGKQKPRFGGVFLWGG